DPALQAASLIGLALALQSAGDDAQAAEAYQQALSRLPSDPQYDVDRTRALLGRGALLNGQQLYAIAQGDLEQALGLATRIHQPRLVLAAEITLADIALGQGKLDDAARHLDGAERAWRATGQRTPSLAILLNRAILCRRRGDFAGALRWLDEVD